MEVIKLLCFVFCRNRELVQKRFVISSSKIELRKTGVLTMSSGLLTAAPVGLATEAVETTLPGTVAWADGLPYCETLLKLPGTG